MRAYDIIMAKRNGLANSYQELDFLISHYLTDDIHDDQMAAWLMAVYFQGMTDQETADLTELMMHSGETLDLSLITGVVVDKHSTGGVGDKTTLVVAPLVAAAGVPMAKLSGKGLGFTGGTIDKLEAIPGLRTTCSNGDFLAQVRAIGVAIMGQTQNLVPADKKIYALRDATATVESIPLIASSIMSKKLAAGSHKILLDVKFGSGAFMKEQAQAELLAQKAVAIGKHCQRETVAVLSSMEQPLGLAVGNALETMEAVETLQGKGPADLVELCLFLAGYLLAMSGQVADHQAGVNLAKTLLDSGAGYEKFLQMVAYQGGDVEAVKNGTLLEARATTAVVSLDAGYVASIDAMTIGHCSMLLGAGRVRKDATIDLSAGIMLHKKVGDYVHADEPLATLYYQASLTDSVAEIAQKLRDAYKFSDHPTALQAPLIGQVIR